MTISLRYNRRSMSPRRIWFLLALILLSCSKQNPKPFSRSELADDLRFADQENDVHPRDPAFLFQSQLFDTKQVKTLAQKFPGSVTFYRILHKHPILYYSVRFESRKEASLESTITVESDFPASLRRVYRAPLGGNRQIDLSDFADRAVSITLSAESPNKSRLGGVVYWLNPTVEERSDQSGSQDLGGVESLIKQSKNDNLMIFLFDAANASHLSCYGYHRKTTPVMDSVASDGVIWNHAFSQAVSTLASTGTLFTGLYPAVHQVFKKPEMLSDRYNTMPESFRQAGYQTALFTANPNASSFSGYAQGFQYEWNLRQGRPVFANEVAPIVNQWIDAVKDSRFFAYVHFREPHEPYMPADQYLKKFSSGPDFHLPAFSAFVPPSPEGIEKVILAYDANLAAGDEAFGKVIDHLKKLNLYDRTMIVIIADHGEAFWGHGKQGHNTQVYDDMIHIPMIWRIPQEPKLRGIRSNELIGTIDLFPTFVELFELSRKGLRLSGENMLPVALGIKKNPDRMMLSETSSQSDFSLRSERFKYIYYRNDPRKNEFFDLQSDPQEKNNLIDTYPILASVYRQILLKRVEENEAMARRLNISPERQESIDQQTEEELRALGYVN
jgi:arylsulfatase A-like enzyme